MNTILIATDFSNSSSHAAEYGYRLAQHLGATVLLCYAMNLTTEIPQTGMAAWPADVYDDFTHDADGELAKLRRSLIAKGEPDAYQPEVICLQDAGPVTEVLNRAAVVNKADLIVIGVHGNDALDTLMIGNHNRKMIEATVRPLLLIPAGTFTNPAKKIAFACDFSEPEKDREIIEKLIRLAKTLHAEIILTHVDQHSDAPGYMLMGKQLVDSLITKSGYPNISFTVVSNKRVENGLGWLVHDDRVDMLTMVHREHSFLEQLFKGSFTQKTARELTVPLLVFKPVK